MKSKTNKTRMLLGAVALAAGIMIVTGWSLGSSWIGASPVNAAGVDGDRETSRTQKLVPSDNNGAPADYRSSEEQIQAMLNFALNLRTASEYTVYAEKGIVDNGNSEIRGNRGDALRSEVGSKSTKDLSDSLRAIKQLPCTDLTSTDLSGKTFGPGIYCMSAAELNGELTLDSAGNAAGTYLFRVAGNLDAKSGSSIRLENGAQAGNVFFVADGAVIGDNASFRANILSDGDVRIGSGTTMTDKVLTMGTVELNGSNLVGGTTGTMEICKAQQLPVTAANNLSNQIFQFVVTGATTVGTAANPVKVMVGTCSLPFDVTAGPQTVTELNDGFLATPANGTFSGNFELTGVVNLTPTSPSTLGMINLATRVANVNIVAGEIQQEMVLEFTNRRTITGFYEICKYGLDSDVSGFFNFTIEDVFTINQRDPNIVRLQIFTVPVGFCSEPIAVTKGDPAPTTGPPRQSLAFVSELPRANYAAESMEVIPAANRNSADILGYIVGVDNSGNDVLIPAPGGGFVDTFMTESATPATQTMVRFYNRSLPGRIKVCKFIADNRIPTTTAFNFLVSGTAPTSPTQTMPGVPNTTATVSVLPNSCTFVPGTFIVGTTVTVTETGMNPATFTSGGNTYDFNDIRVSNITANPGLLTVDLPGKTTTLTARNSLAEVDFTNFIFRPTILKVCKAGAPGVTGSATFSLSLVNPLTSWAVNTTPFTIPVGGCTLVNGPFPAIGSFPNIGTFNLGTQVTVTEAANAATVLTDITSPTGNPIVRNGLSGTITLTQVPNNINEIRFLNSPAPIVNPVDSARFDFDGDGKSDKVIFRNGTWWYAASGSGDGQYAIVFGSAGDKLVAADYDGDGKTDPAVYRNGTWYVLGSTAGLVQFQFGLPTDIPQPGDYDGDGKADFAVYRPSEGVWYMQNSTTGFSAIQFGISSDKPVSADFDGDGKTDQAVYRSGTWYVMGSTAGFYGVQFGLAGDIPVQADFDGDGKADQAVYRGGTWHILGSTNGYYAAQFGLASDTPVPADYDGDGKTDIAVYRTSTTEWHIMKSSQALNPGGGYSAAQFGAAGDVLMTY